MSIRAPRAEGDNGIVATGWFTELMAGHHLRLSRQHPDFECDFETARCIVHSDARKTWDGTGTLYVAPYGSEDATHWQVILHGRTLSTMTGCSGHWALRWFWWTSPPERSAGMWSSRASNGWMG